MEETTRALILVRHSLPEIVPGVPSRKWRLSEAGRARCAPLADQLAGYQPAAIVASREPKATETAALVAGQLGLPCEVIEGLEENDRTGFAYVSVEQYAQTVATFFAHPEELVMGRETAAQAERRFTQAIDMALRAHRTGSLVVVAHGTVITLFVARHEGILPFPLWQRLALPSLVALSLPNFRLMTVVESISNDAVAAG